MTLLNSFSPDRLVQWLTDFYLLATVLLLIAMASRRWIRQPAHRLTVAWIVAVELAALAVACALPIWPKVPLLAAAPHEAAATVPEVLAQERPVARRPARLALWRTAWPRQPAGEPAPWQPAPRPPLNRATPPSRAGRGRG